MSRRFSTSLAQAIPWLIGLAFVLTAGVSPTQAGMIIEVKNDTQVGVTKTLSDLIVYGEGGQKNTILKLNDPSDDIPMAPGAQRTFDAGFEVTSYFISTTIGTSEFESYVLKVKQLGSRKISFLEDVTGVQTVYLALDYTLTNYAPPLIGSILLFNNGINAALPGYFVGTIADFDNGGVSSPFTGEVRVVGGDLSVSAVPEPATLVMMSSALAVVGIGAVRRRVVRTTAGDVGKSVSRA